MTYRESETTIDLLRHGEPVGGERFRGTLDDPLSSEGWIQMQNAVAGCMAWEVVVTSPMRRCAEFAQTVAKQLAIPLEIDPRFREMSFGTWEGYTGQELLRTDQERIMQFWQNPWLFPPPGGEHLQDLRMRVEQGWQELEQRFWGGHLLLVAHGGVIRMILALVLKIPLEHLSRITVPYAALSRIRIDRVGTDTLPRLIFHNGRP
ncbi:MAG: histidine phosphatase family protein [Magnetococcus sp. DMHC-6]